MPPFTRIDVSDWTFVRTETIGQSPAEWIADSSEPPGEWLFKPVKLYENGLRQGGDWAEKVVGELARVLRIPNASIELAIRGSQEGSISRNVVPPLFDMWSGRLWLDADQRVSYSSAANTNSRRMGPASTGYSLLNIQTSLVGVGPPPDFEPTSAMSGFEVFCAYLLLDALAANRDRHEDNWGVVQPTLHSGSPMLAPLFDNAGSVGYQLSDANRTAILGQPEGIRNWVLKGSAWRFDERPSGVFYSLVELALNACSLLEPPARHRWFERLDLLNRDELEAIVDQIPGMSVASRTFAVEVIMTNAGRIRDGYRTIAA